MKVEKAVVAMVVVIFFDYIKMEFNILVIGNPGVGKTTIIARYVDNKFLQVEPTSGI